MSAYLNVYKIIENSTVNGPGTRTVVWTQGCSIHCDGCFNKELQEFNIHNEMDVIELAESLSQIPNDGLTISGGEPLDQSKALYSLISEYKSRVDKTVFLFTGYSYEEIKNNKDKKKILLSVDAALCGRYIKGAMWGGKELVVVSGRISAEEIKSVEQIEIVMNGNMANLTGYPII